MLKQYKLEQIKKLIADGFDLELIAFELDIPLEELHQISANQEPQSHEQPTSNLQSTHKPQSKLKTAREVIAERNMALSLKVQKMRERYMQLYYANNQQTDTTIQKPAPEHKALIEASITFAESTILKIDSLSKADKIKGAKSILLDFKKIQDYPLTYDQARKAYDVLVSNQFLGVFSRVDTVIHNTIRLMKKKFIDSMISSIDAQISQTRDIEELRKLSAQITLQMAKDNPIRVDGLKSVISSKISKLQQQIAMDKIRNNVSPNIQTILTRLADGTINLENAHEIIHAEALQRLAQSPQNRFSLTDAQHRQQILIQISTVLMEKNEEYQIINPQKTISDLQKLRDGDLDSAIRSVIGNMVRSKRFDECKKVCDSFSAAQQGNPQLSTTITKQKSEIRNAEISDYVLRGIHSKGTVQSDAEYFRLIEDGLKQANINPIAISLGKNQAGTHTITLADILSDPAEKKNTQSK